jgi:hydroxyacylglutathione hydrolase
MRIRLVPILEDNYSYLLIDDAAKAAAAVDPAEPDKVAAALAEEGVRLAAILCTHHHWDHSGGNLGLLEKFPGAEVFGSEDDAEKIPGITRRIRHGDEVKVAGLSGRALLVPCHTRGHLAYHFGRALFSGDTLFVAGCGRFFEGDAAGMHRALNEVIAALPPETEVYCGHEYTVGNLKFALAVEPENAAAKSKLEWALARREKGLPTIPSTLAEERAFNPFMRVAVPELARAVGADNPVEVMDRLRTRKNNFKA